MIVIIDIGLVMDTGVVMNPGLREHLGGEHKQTGATPVSKIHPYDSKTGGYGFTLG